MLIENLVVSGRYSSVQDAICRAIHLLAKQEKLRKQIQVGVDQADSGELLDHDTVFGQLRSGITQQRYQIRHSECRNSLADNLFREKSGPHFQTTVSSRILGISKPTESCSLSSEKSYSPSRLMCCQATMEPPRIAARSSCLRAGLATEGLRAIESVTSVQCFGLGVKGEEWARLGGVCLSAVGFESCREVWT